MALSGDLSLLTVPDLLNWIAGNALTGVLDVARDGTRFSVRFKAGKVQAVTSNREQDRLGQRLVRDGILSEDLLLQLIGGVPLGRRLVQESLLTEPEVAALLRRHALETGIPILHWHEGTFEFTKATPPETAGVPFVLSAEELLLEGHRRLDESNHAA